LHPAGAVSWPSLVVPPRTDQHQVKHPGYLLTAGDKQNDGFDVMSAALGIVGRLRRANGEDPTAVQYYAPLLLVDSAGASYFLGGGLGTVGGAASVGDSNYRGIFLHEQGHALSLPHQGDAFQAGKYPYVAGSLAGSAWGYDPDHREFLAPFVPSTAKTAATCLSQQVWSGTFFDGGMGALQRQLDAQGRCVKQDPMQSGDGDQAQGYHFATFSDFSSAMMQRWFEGVALPDGGFTGGRLQEFDAGVYSRWSSLQQAWVAASTATTSKGMFGLDQNLPIARDVPVAAIVVALSHADPTLSTIYPPILFTGNLLHTIDPSSSSELASIIPDTSMYPWYCRSGGCDYTLRVTYSDQTVRHVLLQGGFRPTNQPIGAPPATASDPLDSDSFEVWVINVPAGPGIAKLEVLDTPMVWNGFPSSPTVLLTR
jgi:hypothetical protein